jgi:hypothetical protein
LPRRQVAVPSVAGVVPPQLAESSSAFSDAPPWRAGCVEEHMNLTRSMREAKLRTLVEAEGFASLDELLAAVITDSVCPAICTAEGCSYTCEMESDQDRGWCEACGRNTMQSALILVGLI